MTLSTSIPPEVMYEIDKLCKEHDYTRVEIARAAIAHFLKQPDPVAIIEGMKKVLERARLMSQREAAQARLDEIDEKIKAIDKGKGE